LNYEAEGSVCYGNDPANGEKYGRLYDFETAKKSCPPGWHLPSEDEWEILVDFIGGEEIAGKKLKAADGWNSDEEENSGKGTDEFGFSALPSGNGNSVGSFSSVGYYGYWWSATEYDAYGAYYQCMYYYYEYTDWSSGNKYNLFSVRCLQD
jgi:uncharacterized protein (TIGR02145 family)